MITKQSETREVFREEGRSPTVISHYTNGVVRKFDILSAMNGTRDGGHWTLEDVLILRRLLDKALEDIVVQSIMLAPDA